MENPNASHISLKRERCPSDDYGSFKIMQTENNATNADDESLINFPKTKVIGEYKITYNENRQSNRHKTPSGVWKYFVLATKQTENTSSTQGDVKTVADDRILCMLCYAKGRVHVYKSKTSSSNLWKHLNRKHDIEIPTDRTFAICTSSLDRYDFVSEAGEEVDDGASSTEYPSLVAMDDDDNDVIIKTHDFDEIEEYTEVEEMQEVDQNVQFDGITLEAEDERQENVQTMMKYQDSTVALQKDIGLAIVEEVAMRQVLYQTTPSSKLASVRAEKEAMWMEIYEALGRMIPIKRIQKIWINIRDRYRKIRHMERQGQELSPKYKYYDHLSFLEDVEPSGNHFSDGDLEEPPNKKPRSEDFSLFIEQSDGSIHLYQNYSTKDVVSETSSNCIVSSSIPPLITTTIYPNDTALTKQTANPSSVQQNQPETKLSLPRTTIPTSSNRPVDQMDEFDLFGRLIANKLRNAPKDRVNLIEVRIMQAILENL